MSSHESPVNELDHPPRRRIQRRHGACEPCRSSKTKCDGRTPCGACRSERRRQCPCVYSEKAMKLQQVTAEIQRRAESEKQSCDELSRPNSEDESKRIRPDNHQDLAASAVTTKDDMEVSSSRSRRHPLPSEGDVDLAKMTQPLSVCAAVEEFKRLKAAKGYSAQVVSRCHGFDIAEHIPIIAQFADTGPSHSDNELIPIPSDAPDQSALSARIQTLESRLAAVEATVGDGYLNRAWAEIGSIAREAQLTEDVARKTESGFDSPAWRRLWNNILDLEAQLGLTIGRPTCLIRATVSRPNIKNDTLSLEDSIEETRTDLYRHIQGMLGLDVQCPTAIRDFLERSQSALHHEPFNQIGLCTTERHSAEARDLHLSTHLFFMVVYCRMASLCDSFSRDLTNKSWSQTPAEEIIRDSNLHQPRQKLACCRKMFRSANFILDSFMSLDPLNSDFSGRDWLRCHSAYVAATILGIAKLRHEVEWHATTEKLRKLERLFQQLSQANPQCNLFRTAVDHLRDIDSVKEPASEATLNKHTGIKNRKRNVPASMQANTRDVEHRVSNLDLVTSSAPSVTACKRPIDMVSDSVHDIPGTRDRFVQNHDRGGTSYEQPPQSNQPYDLNLEHMSLFQDMSANYSQTSNSFTTTSDRNSLATSFSGSDMSLRAVTDIPIDHPGPPFAYPFPSHAFHPPMVWNSPVYTMHAQAGGQLSLQIPIMPQYGTNHSPMTCEMDNQYDLGNNSSGKASAAGTIISSPPPASSDGTVTSTRPSPSIHSGPIFKTSTLPSSNLAGNSISNQSFLQPVDAPLAISGQSVDSRRSSIDQRQSNNAVHGVAPSMQDGQLPSAIGWHSSSSATVSQDHEGQSRSDGITLTSLERGSTPHNMRRADVHGPRHEADTCMFQPMPQSQPQLNGSQFFHPDPVAYLNPPTGIFEQTQIHNTYAQAQLPQYAKYYISSSDQYPEQWRRISVDAGGHNGVPY